MRAAYWCLGLMVVGCGQEYNLSEEPDGDVGVGDGSGVGPGDDVGAEAEEDPSPYIQDESTLEPPLLDMAGVEIGLAEAVATFMRWDPNLWIEAYTAAMVPEDDYCPYYYDDYVKYYGYEYWYGGCNARSGAGYDGYLYGWQYDAPMDYGDYVYHKYGWRDGEGTAELADGQVFEMAGYHHHQEIEYQYSGWTPTYLYSQISGEVTWKGAAFEGTWLSENWSFSLVFSGGSYPGYGAHVDLEGGISNLPGLINAVNFENFFIGTAYWGSNCEIEPGGNISLRDAAGEWYTVAFDGATYSGGATFLPECDGCGTVWYRGQALGEACADFSALTSWEGRPW